MIRQMTVIAALAGVLLVFKKKNLIRLFPAPVRGQEGRELSVLEFFVAIEAKIFIRESWFLIVFI